MSMCHEPGAVGVQPEGRLQPADLIQRPVDEKSFAKDSFLLYRAEDPTVSTVVAIVPHHKDPSRRHFLLLEVAVDHGTLNVWLFLSFAINVQLPIVNCDGIALDSNHALYIVLFGRDGRMKDNHVTGLGFLKIEGEPTDQHPVSAHKSGCLLYTSDAADEEDSVDLGG